MTRPVMVDIEARDVRAIARFWAQALGRTVHHTGGTWHVAPARPDPADVTLSVVAAYGPPTRTKNRLHLDLASTSAAHRAELVGRLRDLGATSLDVGQGEVPWTVLADPEGNAFCVLEPRETYRDTGPPAAVVIDCVDPHTMASFWGEALHWTVHEVTEAYASLRSPRGTGPYLEFLRTPDSDTEPDRLLMALLADSGDPAAEVARLRTLGATGGDAGRGEPPGPVLADPEGHAFRVVTPVAPHCGA
ncbi:VOC family protein [Streptomyces albogriseolus]|uniref:VOC family protein n=1 Tax=Streptomyces albogriseolus TaxID=1887 RepID=UPI0033A3E284